MKGYSAEQTEYIDQMNALANRLFCGEKQTLPDPVLLEQALTYVRKFLYIDINHSNDEVPITIHGKVRDHEFSAKVPRGELFSEMSLWLMRHMAEYDPNKLAFHQWLQTQTRYRAKSLYDKVENRKEDFVPPVKDADDDDKPARTINDRTDPQDRLSENENATEAFFVLVNGVIQYLQSANPRRTNTRARYFSSFLAESGAATVKDKAYNLASHRSEHLFWSACDNCFVDYFMASPTRTLRQLSENRMKPLCEISASASPEEPGFPFPGSVYVTYYDRQQPPRSVSEAAISQQRSAYQAICLPELRQALYANRPTRY